MIKYPRNPMIGAPSVFREICLWVLLGVVLNSQGWEVRAMQLGVDGPHFTLDSKPEFLLGISYYGALGASREIIERDLDDLRRHGFNWLRVWATWDAFNNDVSAVDGEGRPREPFWGRLQWLVAECDRRSMVVDVTLARGNGKAAAGRLPTLAAHRRALETLITELKPYRNWYLDLANERNVRDERFVSFAEFRQLRDLARQLDPRRLVTASDGGDISRGDLREYLRTAQVDFICPHRGRTADLPALTEAKSREYRVWMKELGRVVPVHYQEPFRRGYTPQHWEPPADAFATDYRGARAGGAAGWCFHNGDQKDMAEGKPRRSFDLRQRRLFEQLDAEELAFLSSLRPMSSRQGAEEKPGEDQPESGRLRVIIETDAGGDPDDEQSLVRFLLYANEWDVEGIICNRPKARDGENLNPERTGLGIMQRFIRAYGECHPNLIKHDARYPKPEDLFRRTVSGYADSDDGVKLILSAVDSPDPRPVWFMNWGTDDGSDPSSLKRALDRVLKDRGPAGYATFKRRLRLSGDDQFGDHTTKTAPPFPLWVDTLRPEMNGRRWYHRFSVLTANAGGFDLRRDVLTGHGPLGALYPNNTGPGQKEGDTMMFLYLVPTGMNDPEQPAWGSWAGRYGRNQNHKDRPYYWANQEDAWQGTTTRENTLGRWAVHLQNDFKARLDWCVTDFSAANHPPTPRLQESLRRMVAPGAKVRLDASGSTDPDHDRLQFAWIFYPEIGNYRGPLPTLDGAATAQASFVAPDVDSAQAIHLILAVTDQGTPPLTRYRRVIVTVDPKAEAVVYPVPRTARNASISDSALTATNPSPLVAGQRVTVK
ncbi:MAG: nucleoside hydrolase-like domain-containing protein [Verrucomicrobiota bacterium]